MDQQKRKHNAATTMVPGRVRRDLILDTKKALALTSLSWTDLLAPSCQAFVRDVFRVAEKAEKAGVDFWTMRAHELFDIPLAKVSKFDKLDAQSADWTLEVKL